MENTEDFDTEKIPPVERTHHRPPYPHQPPPPPTTTSAPTSSPEQKNMSTGLHEADLWVYDDTQEIENPDEADPGEEMQDDSDLQDEYYKSLTTDHLGGGWFNQELRTMAENVELSHGSRYRTVPRAYDKDTVSTVPENHPIRAFARALETAPSGSIIRVYAFMLTDPFAIDMLIHYGKNNPIRLILFWDEDGRNKKAIDRFFKEYGDQAKKAFAQRISLEWVVRDTEGCSRFTQMHAKTIITDDFCLTGSYILSCPARCASWEHVVALTTEDSDKEAFDDIWNMLDAATKKRKAPAHTPTGVNPYAKKSVKQK